MAATGQPGGTFDTTVTFSVSGTIGLAFGPFHLAANFTIRGPAGGLTVERVSPDYSRIFMVDGGQPEPGRYHRVTIEDLTIRNGWADDTEGGGGILNRGDLTLRRVNLIGNRAATLGGGIHSTQGALFMVDCTAQENTAGGGGGIAAAGGPVTIRDSAVVANEAVGTDPTAYVGGGGLLIMTWNTELWNTEIRNNTSALNGGGIAATATFQMYGGLIHKNTASAFGGGVFVITSEMTIKASLTSVTLTDNRAGQKGGGVYVWAGNLELLGPQAFTGNTDGDPSPWWDGGGYRGGGFAYASMGGLPPGSQVIYEDPLVP
jgi:predicted outer membrane repeat protein